MRRKEGGGMRIVLFMTVV